MTRKYLAIGVFSLTVSVTCYAIYLSLDPQRYFYYTPERIDLWEYDAVEVAIICASFLTSGFVVFLALLSQRPRWLWQRCALALLLLLPWAYWSVEMVMHAPEYIVLHALWVLAIALGVFTSGVISLAMFVIRALQARG